MACCACLSADKLARTKLAKENEPEENPKDFPSTQSTSNELYLSADRQACCFATYL